VIVRRVRADEWPQVRDLRIAAIRESPLTFAERLEEVESRPEQRWRDRVAVQAVSDTDSLFVAESGELEPVGMCAGRLDALRDPAGPVFFLHYSYVVPAWRGRGVITALTAAVVETARSLPNVTDVSFLVHDGNDAAITAYTRLGFVDSGEMVTHPVHTAVKERVLRLPLRPAR
jgi:ribosomal protein S18 acetylase RimI-like enzyme